MSYSSLYGIKKDYTGECLHEYGNSWLFSPIVWGILSDKYLQDDAKPSYGYGVSILMGNEDVWNKTNNKVNNCDNTPDRVCWELSHQQIFFAEDKECVANNIKKFIEQNNKYYMYENGEYPLEQQHIIDRFNEIADDILALDEDIYECFVFKNSSVDDNVECWFEEYDEEHDVFIDKSIEGCTEHLADFVFIADDKITGFIKSNNYLCVPEPYKYEMPNDIKNRFTNDILKDFVDKFVEVFNIEHMTYEDAAYAEGTAGWYSAFKYMCENNDLNDVIDYYDNLPWYESDLFDDKLTGLLVKYDLLEDSGCAKNRGE